MSCMRYLQRLGRSWYVRVKVPRALQGRVGNTHIRRALGTRNLDEANRLKWAAVAQIQAHLDAVRSDHAGLIAAAGPGRDPFPEPEITPSVPPLPVTLSPLHPALRKPQMTLQELLGRWLTNADYIEQTKHQHRQAVGEFLTFLGREQRPSDVSREAAATYVEEQIKASDRSYSTKRRKLDSLIAFWNWLAEQRLVAMGTNPWRGFRLGKKSASKTRTRAKRPYRDAELVTLFKRRPRFPGLADVVVLGLYTGARMEELCALKQGNIRKDNDGTYLISVTKAKTPAGIRTIAVSHCHAVAVLERRWSEKQPADAPLFDELAPGGYDGKLSWGASKAFGRYRDRAGLSRETDFHSFRRSFITLLENLGVDQVRIARYVGHELPTLAFTVYSGGSTEATMKATAREVQYPADVEAAVASFLAAPSASGTS